MDYVRTQWHSCQHTIQDSTQTRPRECLVCLELLERPIRSLTARELPQQYKGYLVYCNPHLKMLKNIYNGTKLFIPNAGVLNKSIYKENNKDDTETQLFNPIYSTFLKYIVVQAYQSALEMDLPQMVVRLYHWGGNYIHVYIYSFVYFINFLVYLLLILLYL